MHLLTTLSCLVACASAAPTIQEVPASGGARFSLDQIENVHYQSNETGLDARLWAYVKYNAELPDSLQEAVRIGEHVHARFRTLVGRGENEAKYGTVMAFPPREFDIQYVVPVQIGQPAQTVFLNLDTGSGDM